MSEWTSTDPLVDVHSRQMMRGPSLKRVEDRGEFVVGLADAAARVLVYRRAGATAVVAIELPEGQ